ncbi:MAG: hypothetical protein V3T33_09710, partial [Myxococcota bacterium]
MVLALALAVGACDLHPVSEDVANSPSAPVSPRATLVLEPSVLRLGELADLEIIVVTPPEHRVLPISPPEIPGLWVVDREDLPTHFGASRWVHRTRLRVRARELGLHHWPTSSVLIETSDGKRSTLELGARDIEVVSTLSNFPERITPFGLRSPGRERVGANDLLAVALGAGSTLLGVLVWMGAQRLRRRRVEQPVTKERGVEGDLFEWAERELSSARA